MIFSKTYPSFLTLKEGSTFLSKPLFNSLYAPFGSPSSGGQKPSGTRGCNRPTVLNFLPLRLSCKESSTFSPSPSSSGSGGCNRPTVLFFRKSPRPSLPLKRAPPLTPTLSPSGEREETALLGARNRYALRLAGHQSPRHILRDGTARLLRGKPDAASKPSPCCAGWDRRGWEVYNL